jgi:oligopeptide transport system substrate-binding protein
VQADPAAARTLLAGAGFADGAGFPAIELMVRNDEIMPRLAEAIQAMWRTELGIEASISQVEQKTWIQNQQTLNYTACLSAWTADYPDPLTFLELFLPQGAYNWTGWNDDNYQRRLDLAAAATPGATRIRYAVLRDAEERLLHEAPIAPLYFGAQTYLLHPAVKGWAPSPLAFRRFQRVSLAP